MLTDTDVINKTQTLPVVLGEQAPSESRRIRNSENKYDLANHARLEHCVRNFNLAKAVNVKVER